MTRINVVPVAELCDEHLRAEYREIVRIPQTIGRRDYKLDDAPEHYTVRTEDNSAGGRGHVKFFYDKLLYLHKRFIALEKEMKRRGFKLNCHWPKFNFDHAMLNDYEPTPEALELNRKRLTERMPKHAHHNRTRITNE